MGLHCLLNLSVSMLKIFIVQLTLKASFFLTDYKKITSKQFFFLICLLRTADN